MGADRYERTDERTALRNGARPRPYDTRVDTLDLTIPKRRTGSSFPTERSPRRRAEQALVAVVAEASVQGVSTRNVEALIQTLGISGISKSEVSRPCASLDAQVAAFRPRPLDGDSPSLWLDARAEQVREDGRVQSMAVVVAYGVRAAGRRAVPRRDVAPGEHAGSWRAFLQSLVARGVRGVHLVVSDAHPGLKHAIRAVFVGAAWQRCRVHTIRTQSRTGRLGSKRADGLACVAEGDDMPHLQVVIVDDDPLDEKRQDPSLLVGGRILHACLNACAEGGEVGEHCLGLRTFLPQRDLLCLLLRDRLPAERHLPPTVSEFLQADDARLIGIQQPARFSP
jgi:hypothetical protein